MDIKQKKSWLTEGVVLALVPAIAYFVAFQYESGYAEYFGIPNELIEINLINVLSAGFGIYSFLLTFFGLLFILPRHSGPITRSLIRLSPAILVFLFSLQSPYWLLICVMLAIFSFLTFVMPLITQRHVRGYRNKLEADEDAESSFQQTRLVGSIVEYIGKSNWLIIMLLILAVGLSSSVGRLRASNKTDFLVIPKSPETVVLRIYGDKLICSTFDRNTKKIEEKFFLMKPSDVQNIMFVRERIGPLSLPEKPLIHTGYVDVKKNIIKYKYQILLFIIGLSLLLIIIHFHKAGVFRTVKLDETIRGPYKIVSTDVTGYRSKEISPKIKEAKQILNEFGITSFNLCFVYYGYFKTTSPKNQKIRAGILISPSQPLDEKVILDKGLQLETIPKRNVIVGRLKGSLFMVYFKIIPKISKWINQHGLEAVDPMIQIQVNDKFIEVELPISNKVKS